MIGSLDCEKEDQTICQKLSFQDLKFKKQMEVGNICSVVEMILQKFLGDDLSHYNVSGHEYGINNENGEKIQVEISQKKPVPEELVTKLVEFANFVLPEYLVEKFSSVKVIKRTIAKVCSRHSQKKRGGGDSSSGACAAGYNYQPKRKVPKKNSDTKTKNSVKPSELLPNHHYPHHQQYYPQMYPTPPGFHSNPNAQSHHPQMYHPVIPGIHSGTPPNNPQFNPYYSNPYPNAPHPHMNMYPQPPPYHYPQMYHPVPGFHSAGAPNPQTPYPAAAYGNNPISVNSTPVNQYEKPKHSSNENMETIKILKITKKEKAKSIAKKMKIGVNVPGVKQPIPLDDSELPKDWKR